MIMLLYILGRIINQFMLFPKTTIYTQTMEMLRQIIIQFVLFLETPHIDER